MRYFEKQSKVVPEDGKYIVYSEAGRKFGEYDSLEKAHKRLQQMEMFKHMNKTAMRYFEKKSKEMTPKEKADQKYAIAKRYEEDGHPRKAKEYKDKAGNAYKRAYEKKASEAYMMLMEKKPFLGLGKTKRIMLAAPTKKEFGYLYYGASKKGFKPTLDEKTGKGTILSYNNPKDKSSFVDLLVEIDRRRKLRKIE